MSFAPISHRTEALKLTADGLVDLMEIRLKLGAVIRFKNGKEHTWQGNLYENIPHTLRGTGQSTDETLSRPQLQIVNPDGIFSSFIEQGMLINAEVRRYTLLYDHLLTDQNIYTLRVWRVARTPGWSSEGVLVELRELGDRPNFVIPPDTFSPPRFPVVTLR